MSLPLYLRRSFVPGIIALSVLGCVIGVATLKPVITVFLAGLGPDFELSVGSPRVVVGASSTWIGLTIIGLVGPFAALQYLRYHLPLRRPGVVYLLALAAGTAALLSSLWVHSANLALELEQARGPTVGEVPVDLSMVPLLPAGLAFAAVAMAVVILAGIRAAYCAERARYDL